MKSQGAEKNTANNAAQAETPKAEETVELKTGKVSAIRFSTLEAICEALNCQPGDILEYDPSAE